MLPAFNIKIIDNIIPKKTTWANVLPATLVILLLDTKTASTIKTKRSMATTIRDSVRVVVNGDISICDRTCGSMVCIDIGIAVGIIVGATVSTTVFSVFAACAIGCTILSVYIAPKN